MTHATLARKAGATTASQAKTPSQNAPGNLRIGEPDDAFEQEADRVADRVMSAVPGKLDWTLSKMGISVPLRFKASSTQPVSQAGPLAPPIVHEVLRSPGQTVDAETRAFMEPRFGADFSNVHVHTDAKASSSAHAIGARAYSVGQNVIFGPGEYRPRTVAGRKLLAHELTHVMQQGKSPNPQVQRKLRAGTGLALDTQGFITTKTGDELTCPAVVKSSIWNETFTSLLFSPRVFTVTGTTNAEVKANLTKHMGARLGILDFASKKKYSFGAGDEFRMNPAYWIVDANGWRPKPGVDENKAIQDLNVHPKEYAIACEAATLLTMRGGSGSQLTEDSGVLSNDWIPGDWGYIKNTKFPASGGSAGLEGENIIYTGKDKFWGHFGPGVEYKLINEWNDQVKSWNGGAQIEATRKRPTLGLT